MTLSDSSDYSRLKRCIIRAVGEVERHSELISTLKEMFKDEINSIRRFEQINSIGMLLNVLEIRDVLSEDNVECLKSIVLRLPNSKELLKRIIEYEERRVHKDYENYYSTLEQKTEIEQSFISITTTRIGNNISKRKKLRIFQTIVDEIGGFWRDLARNLQIRECDIDDIDLQNKNVHEKASKIMHIYEYRKADPDRWFFVLCDALEKTRRKDLVKSIQDIMAMNI